MKLNINNLKKIIEENEIHQIKEKENKFKELNELNNVIEEKDKDLNLYVEEINKVKEDLINYKRNESKLCDENLTLANKLKTCLQTIDRLESMIKNYESEKANLLKINEENESNLNKSEEKIKSLILNHQKELYELGQANEK